MVIPSAGAAVAGAHVGLEQDRVGTGVVIPQLRHPLGRLPVCHPRIIEPRGDQHGRILGAVHVVVGRIRPHVLEVHRVVGIAPLLVLQHRERNTGVEHRRHHIHERHVGHDRPEEIRAGIGDSAHQETAGAAAADGQQVRRGPLLVHQVLRHRDEVAEGVPLLQQLAVLVPGAAQVLSASRMGQRHHQSPVQQRDPVAGEGGIDGDAIGPIGGEQHGPRRVAFQRKAVDHRNGDAHAIGRGGEHPLGAVPGRVIAAQYRLLLPQVPGAVVHTVVEHAGWGHHRGIGEPERGSVKLRIAAAAHRPHRLGKLHVVLGAGLEVADADLGRRVLPLPDDQMVPERVDPFQPNVVAARDDLAPVFAGGGLDRGLDQPEVDRVVVGGDEEPVAVVLHCVLDLGAAGLHQPGRTFRLVRVDEPDLAGTVAAKVDHQKTAAAGAKEREEVEAVGLLEHHFVVIGRIAQPVAHHPERALGLVQGHVEEPLAVCAPLHCRGEAADVIGEEGPGGGVEHLEVVLFVARRVRDIGQEPVIGRRLPGAEPEVLGAFGEGVLVQQELVGWAVRRIVG